MGYIIAGSILIGIVLFVLIFSCVTYCIAFYSPKNRKEDYYDFPDGVDFASAKEQMTPLIDELINLPCEEVEITSFDGLRLKGRYYFVQEGAPLEIQFHGYRGTAFRDFCGGGKIARECGHNVLLVDQRAHGRSGGTTITFGIKERFDCLSWIEYAVARFGEDMAIYLSGVSMGATTVLMASGLDLPKNVKGIIADCPFSSPEDIIKKTIKEMHISPKLAFPFVALGAKLFGGFNVKETSAKEEVKKAQVPILLVHGDQDTIVPYEMAQELYASNSSKITLEVFEGAGHAMSYIVDNDRYKKMALEFLKKAERE